jgi:hypothetical protein
MIKFLIKKSLNTVVPEFFSCETTDKTSIYRPVTPSLNDQLRSLGVAGSISILSVEDFPTHVDDFLVCVLDENSLVPDDYIARIMAMNNLHRDAALFCGPVGTHSSIKPTSTINKILELYKTYHYDSFSRFISCEINNDYNYYPPITGCVISGRVYNMVHGYKPQRTVRSIIENNKDFFCSLSKLGPMIYSNRLSTFQYLTSEDLKTENLIQYWYTEGYSSAQLDKHNKVDTNKESSKLLKLEYLISNTDSPNDSSFKFIIDACKCMYSVGYYECLTNSKIL